MFEVVVVGGARVEVLRVAFRSSEEERRAVSRAWRSVAMRWARGTSSMRRKSRVEAATWGLEGVVSVVCDVVVAMVVIVFLVSIRVDSLALAFLAFGGTSDDVVEVELSWSQVIG